MNDLEIGQTYLGDGLYADFDGYQIKLSAGNGISDTDTVYLKREVFESLWAIAKKIGWAS